MGNIREASDCLKAYIDTKEGLKAQYTVTETETREITMENGEFTLFRTLFDNDVRVNVIHNHKIGKTSTNKLDKADLEKVVDDALTAADSGVEDENYDIAPGMEAGQFHQGVQEPDIDKLMLRARELSDDIAKNYPRILLMQMIFKYEKKHYIYRNTNGSEDEVTSGCYLIILEYAGNDGEKSSGIFGTGVMIDNLDIPFMEQGSIRKNLEEAEASISPCVVEGKWEGSVIFTPAAFEQMLIYSFGAFAGDNVILSGESKWLGKIGENVASDKLTIGIKPWDERLVKTDVITEDGFRAEDYNIIENGVLKSYMASLYVSNKCGVERAKNSSMSIVIEGGEIPLEDMISGIDRGLIIGAVSCGIPSANGEISGAVKNSFYVENGKIVNAVSETMVSFNLSDMLLNVEELSKETVMDGTGVIPYAKVGKVTISGR